MIKLTNIQIKYHNSISKNQLLTDNKSVYIRVKEYLGNNKYSALINGQNIILNSENNLLQNPNFHAIVKLIDGKLFLSLLTDSSKEKLIETNQNSIYQLLEKFGLPQNNISEKLIQFMQQMNIKLDIQQIKKVIDKTKHFNKKTKFSDEELAESELFFELKNLNLSNDNIISFLTMLNNNDFSQNKSNQNEHKNKQHDYKDTFIDKIYTEDSTVNLIEDFFTIQNHVLTKNSNYHWILLPFYFINKNRYNGVIRLLLNTEQKKLEKIHINCESLMNKFFFMLYYNLKFENKANLLKFYTEPSLTMDKQKVYIRELQSIFQEDNKQINVIYSENAKTEGIVTENKTIYPVDIQA